MIYLLCSVLLAHFTQALPDRARCNSHDLSRQDCRLQASPWKFQLSNKTVAWSDGVWSSVDDIPLNGPGLTWEKAQLKLINKRVLLQLWVWDAGVGEGQVQTLHWIVLEFADRKMTVVLNKPVRKRHPQTISATTVKFVFDPMDVHHLTAAPGGKIKWTHLKSVGEF